MVKKFSAFYEPQHPTPCSQHRVTASYQQTPTHIHTQHDETYVSIFDVRLRFSDRTVPNAISTKIMHFQAMPKSHAFNPSL